MRASCFVLGLVAFAFTGTAPAQVLTVKVPETIFVGVSMKVRIEGGTSPCGAATIDFGDRADPDDTITYPLPNGFLSFEVTHVWKNEGTFTVKATGQGNCTGSASAVVHVTKLKPLSPLPRITGYFGLARPGAVAAVLGKNFGSNATVTATLKTPRCGSKWEID